MEPTQVVEAEHLGLWWPARPKNDLIRLLLSLEFYYLSRGFLSWASSTGKPRGGSRIFGCALADRLSCEAAGSGRHSCLPEETTKERLDYRLVALRFLPAVGHEIVAVVCRRQQGQCKGAASSSGGARPRVPGAELGCR